MFKKDDTKNFIEQQSKLTFNGSHKSYEYGDSYTFKQNEVLIDKPIYLGFAMLAFSKLIMYETYYELQPHFGQGNLQFNYIGCDSFVLGNRTQNKFDDLKKIEYLSDFRKLDEHHELFSKKNKKFVGKFKIQTPENI